MLRIMLAIATLAVTASTATPALAQSTDPDPRPLWPEDGITATFVVKQARGHLVVRFSGTAAKAWRRMRGAMVAVNCDARPRPNAIGADPTRNPGPPGTSIDFVRMPRTGMTLRAGVNRGDACYLTAARRGESVEAYVGVTERGRTWTDELHRALDIARVSGLVERLAGPSAVAFPSAEAVVAAGRGEVVALDAPDATPPLGLVGYWTDGAQHEVLASPSAAGRRMFLEYRGADDSYNSNILGHEVAAVFSALSLLFAEVAAEG